MSEPTINLSLFLQPPGVQAATEALIPGQASASIAHLTRRLGERDEGAFREFHELYFDRLFQFLLVVARGQEHEAQEALQETFLRVLRYARAFETEEAFWGWLKVVARSAARDRGRKQQRYFALLQNFALRWSGHDNEPQQGGEETRLSAVVEESLADLNSADRALVEGKYIQEETVKELSSKTGLTGKAVESRLLRLRRQLRERILKKLSS